MKLNAYMALEEEYEELKEKVKYEGGKFLDNDRKDNEIIILRRENSSLKKEIIKFEGKIKNNENKNKEYQDKINPLDQESYPQDTEYVFNANVYPQDDKAQQESNQKLYEQEGSPQIGGAYEVAINESSPEKEVQTPQIQIQEQQEQNEPQNINSNQYSPEKLAMYQDQININAKPENPPKEEIKNEKPEIIDNNQVNQAKAQIELKPSNEQNVYEIKQSGVSTQGPVDLTTLASQKSAAPINTNSQVVNTQKVVQTPLNNSPYLINQQVPQVNSQIQVKEAEADEDLNKYFQIPTNLQKAKPNVPNNEVKKNEEVNVASVKPIEGNDDINKYFNQIIPEQNTNTNTNNMTDQEILNKYFSQPNQNVQNVPNNFKQVTTTTTTKTTGNINLNNIPPTQINNLVNMNNIPATFGSNDINNFKQTTTTTTTKTTGNIPPSQINKIVDINNIPATFGSNDIKNFKQTTTTTTTQTTGNIPPTFGSSNINDFNPNQKTTVTTTTSTSPIDLKQFGLDPNQFSSEPIDLKQFGLEPNSSQISVGGQKNVAQPVEDYSKYFQNIQPSSISNSNPIDLKQFGLEKNASNISNVLQGSNITFKQPGQSIISSNNYGTSSSIAAPNPVITNNNYTNYYKTTKTTTTSIPYPTQVNYGYNYNIPQGKTTTTTVTNTSGIPIKSAVATQNYQNFASTANYTTTNKVVKSYAGPTKVTSYNYNYSYNIPGTTTTTTTTSIRK